MFSDSDLLILFSSLLLAIGGFFVFREKAAGGFWLPYCAAYFLVFVALILVFFTSFFTHHVHIDSYNYLTAAFALTSAVGWILGGIFGMKRKKLPLSLVFLVIGSVLLFLEFIS
jgi:uncharacterized membrane protein YoaT (DUF817 family)